MSGSFIHTLVEAQERFWAATSQERIAGCKKYLDTSEAVGAKAWDLSYPGADGDEGYKGTVTLFGECHYRWEINYALFGVLNCVCGHTLEEAQAKAFAYKLFGKTLENVLSGNFTCSMGTPDSTVEWNTHIHNWVLMGYKGQPDPSGPGRYLF